MLMLQGKLRILQKRGLEPYLVTLTKNPSLPPLLRRQRALLSDTATARGYKSILINSPASEADCPDTDLFEKPPEFDYLDEGDIVSLDPRTGSIRCLFRARSKNNTILLTEQCNHYCLMCSQPPKKPDDSWLLREAFDLVRLMPANTTDILYSGGEPTLYGDEFIDLLHHTRRSLPQAAVAVLSNGRAFKDCEYAKKYAAVRHSRLQIGIPIYSDDPVRHDYVVQSKGAFDEAVQGILNLKKLGQRVEVRVVIHKQTIDRLVKTCEFIARNLLFVDHVALMGLEITGFTRANLDILWIDPYEYRDELSAAVTLLNSYGMNCSVYNHQICTVNSDVLPNYRKSISDWKNEYLEACAQCNQLHNCGGLFSSSKLHRHSNHIKAFA
jgi:His-Xaa-Ser system radical SAM maturase HxsC